MNALLAKQLKRLMKSKLPNITITPDENNLQILNFVFYYQRKNPTDTFPLLLPVNNTDGIFIHGKILLDNYPQTAPKMLVNGDVAHCHVYHNSSGNYQICFSLDRTYQWFFKDYNMKESKYNSSMTLKYYVINVYKFLAEDDRESDIDDTRMNSSFDFWKTYPIDADNVPSIIESYQDALVTLQQNSNMNESESTKIDQLKIQNIKQKYNITHFPPNAINYIDFMDKSSLFLENKPIVMPLVLSKTHGTSYSFKIVGTDLMKYDTVEFSDNVFYRSSLGHKFNNRFPVIIHSNIWEKTDSISLLQELTLTLCSSIYVNPVIKINRHLYIEDLYLYTISKLINNMVLDLFTGTLPSCNETLTAFFRLHHLLLYLKHNNDRILIIVEEFFDVFRCQPIYNKHEICPNFDVLLPLNLIGFTNINYNDIFTDILYDHLTIILKIIVDYDSFVLYDVENNVNIIDRNSNILHKTWHYNKKILKKLAFHYTYYQMFKDLTLGLFDDNLGIIDDNLILLLKDNLDNITKVESFVDIANILDISENALYDKIDTIVQHFFPDKIIIKDFNQEKQEHQEDEQKNLEDKQGNLTDIEDIEDDEDEQDNFEDQFNNEIVSDVWDYLQLND